MRVVERNGRGLGEGGKRYERRNGLSWVSCGEKGHEVRCIE